MPQSLSVLWPNGRAHAPTQRLSDEAVADLHLDAIIQTIIGGAVAPGGRLAARHRFAQQVLTELLCDAETIAHRQDVLTDLLENPSLRERLERVLPDLEALADAPSGLRYRPTSDIGLEQVTRRLTDLELLVDAVAGFTDALRDAPLRSEGLRSVRTALEQLRTSAEFAALERELPSLRETLASVRSVIVGINLGADLTPESATILELRSNAVDGRRALLFRLFGGGSDNEALTPLQRGAGGPLGRPNELVRDLRHLLSEVVGPVAASLQRFSRVSSEVVSQLAPELALLLGEARLIDRLRSGGLPVCRPEITQMADRQSEIVDLYDVGLALSVATEAQEEAQEIVTNAARFTEEAGRVWVLTGPNRAGKTTYTRAVGVAHVFCQVGLYVPATSARVSPVDGIYSHFPTREAVSPGKGRLDAEAERLASIFHRATPHSLILLNEALSGTSALEALDLARGLVRALRLLGARAIYVTHLHELALDVDEINASTPGGSSVASLSADASPSDRAGGEADGVQRSYRILPGPPSGVSFAAEIAEQHGISFRQLAELLRERHVV